MITSYLEYSNNICVNYLLLDSKFPPKLSVLKQQHWLSHCLCRSGIQVWLNRHLYLPVSYRLQGVRWVYLSWRKAGRIHFQAHSWGCWQDAFPVGQRTEGLSNSMATEQSPPAAICHMNLSGGGSQYASLLHQSKREELERSHHLFSCNLGRDIHYFAIVYLLGPAHIQG